MKFSLERNQQQNWHQKFNSENEICRIFLERKPEEPLKIYFQTKNTLFKST